MVLSIFFSWLSFFSIAHQLRLAPVLSREVNATRIVFLRETLLECSRLEGDYSPSEFDDEQSSAASHVDLEQVLKAISDLVGADYSAKYWRCR